MQMQGKTLISRSFQFLLHSEFTKLSKHSWTIRYDKRQSYQVMINKLSSFQRIKIEMCFYYKSKTRSVLDSWAVSNWNTESFIYSS